MKTSIALKIARLRAALKIVVNESENEPIQELDRIADIAEEIENWIEEITDTDTEMKVLPIDLNLEEVGWITDTLTEAWKVDLSKMLQSEHHKDPVVVRKFDMMLRLGMMNLLFQGLYNPLEGYPANSTQGRETKENTDASGS